MAKKNGAIEESELECDSQVVVISEYVFNILPILIFVII